MTARHDAVIAKRGTERPVRTDEIEALAEAAGYAVADVLTQTRPEHTKYNIGPGKVDALADRLAATGARVAVLDNDLTPQQTVELERRLPTATTVRDRYRLVLEIFAEQASTNRAQLQVELARLKYALPRVREADNEQWYNRRVEKGSPIYDLEDRIDTLERKLAELPAPADRFRERRREEGFDLVTIAGYTNAGKSALLHRLADDLTLEGWEPDHPDRDPVAAIEDRLFKTLETTTRRATIGGRPVLLTDTVGFVADLPHWLVESFSATLSEAAAADAVVLVVDASDPVEELRSKLRTALEVLEAQGVDRTDIVTALNKIDLLDAEAREQREAVVAELAPRVIPISATAGTNLGALRAGIEGRLPTERAILSLPLTDDAMTTVSWAHDRLAVEDVTYGTETVELTVAGRPELIDRTRGRIDASDDG